MIKKCLMITIAFFSLFLAALFFSFKPYKIMTQSMEVVIKPSDFVLTLKSLGLLTLMPSDIVSFTTESNSNSTIYIKRIIATEGDTIIFNNDYILVNNKQIPHDPIFEMMIDEIYDIESSDDFNTNYYSEYLLNRSGITKEYDNYILKGKNGIIVPENHYFMVGDNYYESMDSRFWGFIPEENIKGKVIWIF